MNTLAPWRSPLSRAIHHNRSQPHSRYLQLATVRADGRPANRTLVFRGFLVETNQLQFATDLRSEKIAQINHQSWGEACWYFSETREQFRLTGQLTLVSATHSNHILQKARQVLWQQLSDAARLQFAWPDPGELRDKDITAFTPPSPAVNDPLSNFCLLLLDPEQVDHLELRGELQNRWKYYLDELQIWVTLALNP